MSILADRDMGRRVLRVSLAILLLPLLAPSQEKPDPHHKVKIGQEAPDFTLQYTAGRTCKLSDLRGKVTSIRLRSLLEYGIFGAFKTHSGLLGTIAIFTIV